MVTPRCQFIHGVLEGNTWNRVLRKDAQILFTKVEMSEELAGPLKITIMVGISLFNNNCLFVGYKSCDFIGPKDFPDCIWMPF